MTNRRVFRSQETKAVLPCFHILLLHNFDTLMLNKWRENVEAVIVAVVVAVAVILIHGTTSREVV